MSSVGRGQESTESKTSENLLEQTGLLKCKLSIDNPKWLAGDLFYKNNFICGASFPQKLTIQNKMTGEIGKLEPLFGTLFIFNWPSLDDDHLFATLKKDQIIIWDASDLKHIKQHRNIQIKLDMEDISNISQVEVFPGNCQLAISGSGWVKGQVIPKLLHLVDITNPNKPKQQKFSWHSLLSENVDSSNPFLTQELIKFCILDKTQIALFLMSEGKDCLASERHLQIKYLEIDFDCWFSSWIKPEKIKTQDAGLYIDRYTIKDDVQIGPDGVFVALRGAFKSNEAYKLINLILVDRCRYARLDCDEIGLGSAAKPIGFASDGCLFVANKAETVYTFEQTDQGVFGVRQDVDEIYRLNPLNCQIIKINKRYFKPEMASSRCLMFSEKKGGGEVFDVSEDPKLRLLAKELADALQRFSIPIVNMVFQYVRKDAHISFFHPVPEKVSLDQKIRAHFAGQNRIINELGNKPKLLDEEKRQLIEAREDLRALEKFTRNEKARMNPLMNVLKLQCEFPNISAKLKDLFDECMAIDPISLADARQKSLTAKPS